MQSYESKGAREALNAENQKLHSEVKKMDIAGMSQKVEKMQDALDGVKAPPGLETDENLRAGWVTGRRGEATMLIPTKSTMENMFDPQFWTAMDPRCFAYGDGVYGLERDASFSYSEYLRYLFNRDELEYDSICDRTEACVDLSLIHI